MFDVWFDFASTYSHLAAQRVEAVAGTAGLTVAWRPFLLGPIFARLGWQDSPFNLQPVKGAYMWRDLERSAQRLGIAYAKPSVFPRNSVLACRVAAMVVDAPWCGAFVRAVYAANFAEDRDIADPRELAAILDRLGQPGAQLVAEAEAPVHKPKLRALTERAAELGIFGAPTFAIGRELFWGNDRLEEAIDFARRPG